MADYGCLAFVFTLFSAGNTFHTFNPKISYDDTS